MKRLAVLALAAAAGCAAGPYNQPYSIIQVENVRQSDPNVVPVIINRVDDRNPPYRDRAIVPPGRHLVTVDVPPRKGFHLGTQSTFEMVTEPCTRYYVAARLDTPVTQEWQPVVTSKDRIGECEREFHMASGAR